ncbi:MAG: hypothetical protein ACLFVP_04105 [Candidatus Bathyarchaeia archaeon]
MRNSDSLLLDIDNTQVRLVAIRKIPDIKGVGITVEEREQGEEFELPFWLAHDLVRSGLARFIEEGISSEEWTQIHFRERFNPLGPLTSLPDDFYKRAHISLIQAKEEAEGDEGKREAFNRLKARYRDIIEARIGKVTRMAIADAAGRLRSLEPEEARLFNELKRIITQWREGMRALGEE